MTRYVVIPDLSDEEMEVIIMHLETYMDKIYNRRLYEDVYDYENIIEKLKKGKKIIEL